jgi:hypothetical protein
MTFRRWSIASILLLLAALLPVWPAAANDELVRRQERIATKYAQLEELMFRMAQLEAAQNPRRAALLNQAVASSKDKHTRLQLETIVELLGKRQLSRATREQSDAEKALEELLRLLQSEDRTERLKTEQERIKEYIKEVDRMIRIQRSIQGQNEGGGDAQRIAQEQQKLADRAGELSDRIKENEEQSTESPVSQERPPSDDQGDESDPSDKPPSDKPPGDMEPGESDSSDSESGDESSNGEPKEGDSPDKQPGDKKPGENKPGESKPSDEPQESSDEPSEEKPSEGKPSGEPQDGQAEPGDPQEGDPQQGKPQQGDPQQGDQQPGDPQQPQNQQQNPVRQKIDQAQQRMRAAEKKLQDAERKESIEEQQKAREELEKAKAELEKILRQLREEEMERTLQALEARFRKMLEMQVKVYEATKKLDAIPLSDRTREIDVQAGRLAGDEAKIAVEAEKALQLLQEEGSSVAFPATVDLLVDDMRQTADRLNQGKVDTITQGLEEEIIASLEELLAALEQAQQKLEEQKQQQQQQQGQPQGGPQEQPLVDQIQELKMIKSLQLRVNTRTERYARLLDDENDLVGQANNRELIDALTKLGDRQRQVFEIVREIVLGRNK